MKVCVIGSGVSGLCSIKACLEEGLDVVCFEMAADIGGLWRYKNGKVEDEAAICWSTTINSSKEMLAFSDYPPPSQYSNYMHHTQALEYLRLYTDHFALLPHIQLNTSVRSVDKADTGGWTVVVESRDDGTQTSHRFDAVLVCTGHHVHPHIPDTPGVGDFRGTVLHTRDYRTNAELHGRNVLVVGFGNSALDVAVDASQAANQVYLSARHHAWVGKRLGPGGCCGDQLRISRWTAIKGKYLPFLSKRTALSALNSHFDHKLYGLRPEHAPNQQHGTICDQLPLKLQSGRIKLCSGVQEFTGNTVTFTDGSTAAIDTVIFGTGYDIRFPFLKDDLIAVSENVPLLYKYMFPPQGDNTLAVIGLVQPLGATWPIAEMQARVACAVFADCAMLPPREEMQRDIERKRMEMQNRYGVTRRYTLQVDFIVFMDELAALLGAVPRLSLGDLALTYSLIFGPCFAYQYRLNGRHSKNDLARTAIMTAQNRNWCALGEKPRNSYPVLFTTGLLCTTVFVICVLNSLLVR